MPRERSSNRSAIRRRSRRGGRGARGGFRHVVPFAAHRSCWAPLRWAPPARHRLAGHGSAWHCSAGPALLATAFLATALLATALLRTPARRTTACARVADRRRSVVIVGRYVADVVWSAGRSSGGPSCHDPWSLWRLVAAVQSVVDRSFGPWRIVGRSRGRSSGGPSRLSPAARGRLFCRGVRGGSSSRGVGPLAFRIPRLRNGPRTLRPEVVPGWPSVWAYATASSTSA